MAKAKANRDTELQIVGLNELLKALNKIDKDLQNNVRDASQQIAYDMAKAAQAEAGTAQARMVAGALKVKRDRVPTVRMPSTGISGKKGVKYTDVFYGSEFGGQGRPSTMQFEPHRGRRGYWLYPSARRNSQRNFKTWWEAVDKAMATWDYKPPAGV
jgi:hypothetical protein